MITVEAIVTERMSTMRIMRRNFMELTTTGWSSSSPPGDVTLPLAVVTLALVEVVVAGEVTACTCEIAANDRSSRAPTKLSGIVSLAV